MNYDDEEGASDEEIEATLDMMFPDRHDPDYNDDDDGYGSRLG